MNLSASRSFLQNPGFEAARSKSIAKIEQSHPGLLNLALHPHRSLAERLAGRSAALRIGLCPQIATSCWTPREPGTPCPARARVHGGQRHVPGRGQSDFFSVANPARRRIGSDSLNRRTSCAVFWRVVSSPLTFRIHSHQNGRIRTRRAGRELLWLPSTMNVFYLVLGIAGFPLSRATYLDQAQ